MAKRRGFFLCCTRVLLNRDVMVGLSLGRMDKGLGEVVQYLPDEDSESRDVISSRHLSI